jgi:predicted amidohydrolase YtcJ
LVQRVSVSGATAEVQMLETMYRYLNKGRTNVSDPALRIDVTEVYDLYRKLLDEGQLTSRATVQGWLQSWKAPHEP